MSQVWWYTPVLLALGSTGAVKPASFTCLVLGQPGFKVRSCLKKTKTKKQARRLAYQVNSYELGEGK